jgi:hypothetical protein
VNYHSGEGESGSVDLLLGRHFHTFTARVGVTDESIASCTANFEVVADGATTLFNETLKYGQSQDLVLQVTGILDLTVTITQESPDSEAAWPYCVGGLGEPLGS